MDAVTVADGGTGSVSTTSTAVPRYGVVGHPVAHSRSPEIHAAFARQTGLAVDYRRVLAPLDAFAAAVARFAADGGRGLNVTVPFKLEARAACGERVTARARIAGAVNWLCFDAGGFAGDNTDGVGLVRDLERVLAVGGRSLAGARLLLVGAGGAARGVVAPLLACDPASLVVVNRERARAEALVATFAPPAPSASSPSLRVAGFDTLAAASFDVVVNATSAGLAQASVPLPATVFREAWLAYDLMYDVAPTRFLEDARRGGAAALVDGLGMLVEQAAESFFLWRGVRPETLPVIEAVRAAMLRP